MTLARIAWKNVSRSFRSYSLYLASIAFNVFVYYLFSSARHDSSVDAVVQSKATFALGMLVASSIIAVFAAVFMWYSSSFFLRRRSREIGLYGLFGVAKPAVSAMFFAENILAGSAALAVGLGLGIPFSKLFMMALLRILRLDARVAFSVSPRAIAETCIVFASLMAVSAIAAAWRVYRFRLADTFRAEKAAERPPRKALALGAASIALMAAGYAISAFTDGRNLIVNFLVVSALTILGTWGFARGGGGLAVGILKRSPRAGSSGPRLVALGDLYFRIGSNARVTFAIAMVSTVSMVALGVGLNLKEAIRAQIAEFSSFTVSYAGPMPIQEAASVLEKAGSAVAASAENRILRARWANKADAKDSGPTDSVRILSGADYLSVLPEDERDKAARDLGSLPSGSLALIVPYDAMAERYLEADFGLDLGKGPRYAARAGLRLYHPGIMLGLGKINMVAPEREFEALAAAHPEATGVLRGLRLANEQRGAPAAKALEEALGEGSEFFSMTFWHEMVKAYDMAFFVGILIGAVFLISSCSILHFKQLMNSADDSKRDEVLFKIGLSDSDARRLAFLRTFPTYALPLALACLHSVVALLVMGRVLEQDFRLQITCVVAAFSVLFIAAGALTTRSCLELMRRSAPKAA